MRARRLTALAAECEPGRGLIDDLIDDYATATVTTTALAAAGARPRPREVAGAPPPSNFTSHFSTHTYRLSRWISYMR